MSALPLRLRSAIVQFDERPGSTLKLYPVITKNPNEMSGKPLIYTVEFDSNALLLIGTVASEGPQVKALAPYHRGKPP